MVPNLKCSIRSNNMANSVGLGKYLAGVSVASVGMRKPPAEQAIIFRSILTGEAEARDDNGGTPETTAEFSVYARAKCFFIRFSCFIHQVIKATHSHSSS